MLKNWLVQKERALRTRLDTVSGEEGFTLIEMSIVLVIIGLLIGGVLKGQELIDSTRLKSVVTQWDAVKAATNGFQDRYNGMPGDYAAATTTIRANGVVDGNGNGVIGASSANVLASASATGDTGENLNFWAHLAAANLVSGVTLGNTAGTAQTSANGGVMPGRIANTFYFVVQGTASNQDATWMRLAVGTASSGTVDPLTEKQTAEIERKYDDSSPVSGSLQASSRSGGTCATGGTYNALNTAKSCSLIMAIQ